MKEKSPSLFEKIIMKVYWLFVWAPDTLLNHLHIKQTLSAPILF